jgi:hypothetical protein
MEKMEAKILALSGVEVQAESRNGKYMKRLFFLGNKL